METLELLERFRDIRDHFYSFSELLPIKELMIFGEFTLIFIFMTSLLFSEYFTLPVVLTVVFVLALLLVSSLILLFSKHVFTFIALLAGILILAGSSIISLFLELSLFRLNIHSIEILFIINAVLIVFIGIKLLKYQYKNITKKSMLFMIWSFSILFIAYVPIIGLDLSKESMGYGLVTSVIFGGFLSVVSSLLYLRLLRDEDTSEEKTKMDESAFSEEFDGSKNYYEKINKLRRD